jgi:hypothetical protein
MKAINWQARRFFLASLLFVLAACTPQATPTPAPTAAPTQRPSATASEVPTTPTPQPRSEIETYTVVAGDTLTRIAAAFNLQPETVLWANYDLLLDIPDFLFSGMQLTILPIDGVYHQVGGGDNINNIAAFFAADPQAIIDWPGNEIDATNPTIFAGQWLIVPGGDPGPRRRLMPNLARGAMAVDFAEFGSGACPQNSSATAQGDGSYAWPVAAHELRGEGFWPGHQAADLAAEVDEAVLAADDGVVTFSGWSNFGYGNAVMLDHGNGEFSFYAGLAEATALCGASVAEGEPLGLAGDVGHPAGVFVHFEIRRGADAVDPLAVLP